MYADPAGCPTDCLNLEVPDYAKNSCPQGYTLERSEINRIYMAAVTQDGVTGVDIPAAYPDDWTLAADWNAVLGNSDSGGATVRELIGIGSKPEAETETTTIFDDVEKILDTLQTIEFNVSDWNQTNYDFLRQLQCNGGGSYYIWYTTRGGGMYGGPQGFQVTIKRPQLVFNSGASSFATGTLMIEWNNMFDPIRIDNPLA